MKFRLERGIGYCGLACVLCSDENCLGCKTNGANGDGCSVSKCAMERKIYGCYACPDYKSCEEGMLQGKRNKAFNRYTQEFGEPALIERLRINYENGITYHTPDKSPGDYDVLETEDEIYRLVRFGTSDPYKKCPVFETEHFTLRLVSESDAEDLLSCYTDKESWELFNSDNCTSDFRYISAENMADCIKSWLDAYQNKGFIRFSIVENKTQKAVGTVEMFGASGLVKSQERGVLRIDLASKYESSKYISELLTLANEQFFTLFQVDEIVTKAIPIAKERIAALLSAGYVPFEWESGREHYYKK